MDSASLRVAIDGPIAQITVSREYVRNALNAETIAALGAALAGVEANPAVRVAIITGAGDRAFVAGADLNELRALNGAVQARQMCEQTQMLFASIAQMHTIVIAAINGYALGGGLELALSCDLRIASEHAKLGLPEVNLGLMPGWGGTQRLARLVGPAMARLLCLTGDVIDAPEALRLGLVERVVPADQLMLAALALGTSLASKAPLALAAIKHAIHQGVNMPLGAACSYEAALFGTLAASDDAREGIAAFLEKRAPVWRGN